VDGVGAADELEVVVVVELVETVTEDVDPLVLVPVEVVLEPEVVPSTL
jgi:hypothetical protein